MTLTITTIMKNSVKRYFLDGKRVSLRTAMQIIDNPETSVIYNCK